MTGNTETFDWKASLTNTYESFLHQAVEIMPQIIGAVGLLILGWIVASILRLVTRKTMGGLDIVIHRFTKGAAQSHRIPQTSYAVFISKIVFWAVLLFFITAASNLLGWTLFAGWMDSLIHHLPNLIMGLLIILGGFVAGGSVNSAVHRISTRAGMANADILALSFPVIVILTTVIIGVEQMGINVDFLTMLIAVIAGILLAGACLAFGLGAHPLVANIIGAQYARKHCRIGETLKIAGIEGSILEITQTSIVLETKKGRNVVPAGLFHKEPSYLETDAGA